MLSAASVSHPPDCTRRYSLLVGAPLVYRVFILFIANLFHGRLLIALLLLLIVVFERSSKRFASPLTQYAAFSNNKSHEKQYQVYAKNKHTKNTRKKKKHEKGTKQKNTKAETKHTHRPRQQPPKQTHDASSQITCIDDACRPLRAARNGNWTRVYAKGTHHLVVALAGHHEKQYGPRPIVSSTRLPPYYTKTKKRHRNERHLSAFY